MITRDTPITQQTLDSGAISKILSGTPGDGYGQVFLELAQKYNIDSNWGLSYIRMENGFNPTHPSWRNNNPWDMGYNYEGDGWYGPIKSTGITERITNGKLYKDATFASLSDGLEAGFWQWQYYVKRYGLTDWFRPLLRASESDIQWADNVIRVGNENIGYNGTPFEVEVPVSTIPTSQGGGGTQAKSIPPSESIGNSPKSKDSPLPLVILLAAGVVVAYVAANRNEY